MIAGRGRGALWRDTRSRVLLLTFLTLAATGTALGVLAAQHDRFFFDQPLMEAVQRQDWFEPFAWFGNEFAHYYMVPACWVASIVAMLWLKRPGLAVLFVLAIAAPALNDELLKETVERPRPSGEGVVIRDEPTATSFPSGHVMRWTAFFGLWIVIAGQVLRPSLAWAVRVAAVLLILLVAAARVWDGVHWPSDTLGSILIGSAYIALLVFVQRRLSIREQLRSGRDRAGRGT